MSGPKPKNLVKAICEGILGYMLYQSRCGIQEAYSEYLLYDPVVRISKDKNWNIKSQYPVDSKKGTGDKKRIDFLLTSSSDVELKIGLEIKYLKYSDSHIDIKKDKLKLEQLKNHIDFKKLQGFIIITGNHSDKNITKINSIKDELNLSDEDIHYVNFKNQFKKNYGVTALKIIDIKK